MLHCTAEQGHFMVPLTGGKRDEEAVQAFFDVDMVEDMGRLTLEASAAPVKPDSCFYAVPDMSSQLTQFRYAVRAVPPCHLLVKKAEARQDRQGSSVLFMPAPILRACCSLAGRHSQLLSCNLHGE